MEECEKTTHSERMERDRHPSQLKNSNTKSNVGDLLAITGAAVDSLGSSHLSNSMSNYLDTTQNTLHTANKKITNDLAFARSFSCVVQSSVSESDHDLNLTTKSQSSIASSSLLNGTATKVKISAKKLKQIKSPFELNSGDLPEIPSHEHKIGHLSYKTAGVVVEKHHSSKNPGNAVSRQDLQHQPLDSNSFQFSKGIATTVTDSGYATQNVQVIHEIQGEQFSQNTSNEEVQSLEDYSQEIHPNRIVEAVHHSGGSQNSSCTQPEIVTVNNSINLNVTNGEQSGQVSSKDESVSGTGSQQSDDNLQERFSRFQPALLKQGSLESGSVSLNSSEQRDQIYIEQYNLNDKKRLLKQIFLKRQNQGPVKRHVQPKLVTSQVVDAKYKKTNSSSKSVQEVKETSSDMQEAVKTAAVAAASAVAATQPFLKAQQDVESKMAQILESLAANEAGNKVAPVVTDTDENLTKQKVDVLERQLHDLTQRRLDYLEKVQDQQVAWQAQMISISQGPSPIQQHQAPKKSVYIDPAILKHKPQQQKSTSPLYDEIQKEKAVLATPAPRMKPPQPTSMYEELKTPSPKRSRGGFLAHILDSQEETPKHSPFPMTPTSPYSKFSQRYHQSPTVKKAEHLLHELSGLNNEIHNAVQSDDVQKVYTGPAPLDHYMSKAVDNPPGSPYPSHVDVRSGDVPVPDNYADAQATLREVKKTSDLLEANIDAILRARQESEVYATLDTLTYGSAPERFRIRKMVDDHIRSMSTDVEREIMEELLRIEEKKKMTFMIPEKDTTVVKGKYQLRSMGRGKGRSESRIDTGLKKARTTVPPRSLSVGKENLPAGRVTQRPIKKVKPVKDEAEVKKVYGRTAHHGQRSTQKDPYIRLHTQPKTKPLPPPVKQTVRGIPMATAKTQTSASSVRRQAETAPQMPMAIPLGVPRRVGSIQIPPGSTATKQVAPSPIGMPRPTITSTPIGQTLPGGNVGLVEVKESFEEDEIVEPYIPQLTKQVLPSVNINDPKPQRTLIKTDIPNVDIDTLRSQSPTHTEPLQTNRSASPSMKQSSRSKHGSPRSKSPMQKFVKEAADELQEAMDEAQFLQESFEDASEEEEDAGIALPGYTRPKTTDLHGPQFPPQMAPKPELDPSSDVIAADIRRRDLLANKAVHWVEQELMARIITEAYSGRGQPLLREPRPETVPHTTPVPKRSKVHKYQDDVDTVSTVSEQPSQHDSLLAEALGQEGMKLFVDAGQPVDENLVHALIKEVLMEKYQSTIGQRTSKEDEEMRHTVKSPRKTKAPSSASNVVVSSVTQVKRAPSPPVQIPDTPVVTPEPTPRGSPKFSPPPHRVATPPETPDVTPEPSVAEELIRPVARRQVVYSEEEDEEMVLVQERPQKHRQEEEEVLQSRHDVHTPENTPPPSAADITARTPSPSLADDYTPIPSEVEEEKQPTPPITPPPQMEEMVRETPPPLVAEPVPESKELFERGQQTSPGPQPSEPTEEEDTETSSWNTAASETAADPLSEGQWILSHRSEGEVLPRVNMEIRQRVREKMFSNNLRLSQEDTLNEAAEFDQDTPNATQSEGEILNGPRGVENDPYLMMLSNIPDPQYMFSGGTVPKMGRDKSLGEISVGPQYNGGNGIVKSSQRKKSYGQYDLVSPGEFLNGDGPRLQPKKWDEPPQQPHDDPEEADNYVQVREVQSPPPAIRTITVRPSTPEESGPQGESPVTEPGSSFKQRPTSQPPMSNSPLKPQVKAYKGGIGKGLGSGLRPQISAGGRPPSPDKRGTYRREETRRSQEVLYGTTSDLETRTMTPDQMNVDVLLASQDYLGETQTELLSTDDLGTGKMPWRKSSEFGNQSGDQMRRSREMGRRSQEIGRRSQEIGRRSQEIGGTGEFGLRSDEFDGTDSGEYIQVRAGRMIDTFGSTSDMSLPEGMTQTLEREEMTHTVDSESDLKLSAKYPDSLEGTGGQDGGESVGREHYVKHVTKTTTTTVTKREDRRSARPQLSFTIPSMGEEDDPSEDYDVSELSLT